MDSYRIRLFSTLALGVVMTVSSVSFYNHVSAAVINPNLDYAAINIPANLKMAPGEHKQVELTVQNVSGSTWDNGLLALSTTYSNGQLGRQSIWKGAGWQNGTTIKPSTPDNILPGNKVAFDFELVAPNYSGLYKEYFALTINSQDVLQGDPLVFSIQVGDAVTIQSIEAKEIRVYKGSQQSDLLENGYVVATLPISSGKPGYTTPTGTYHIFNKAPESYSARYKLYMSNWMGLTRDGVGYEGYGLHSLAYWKTARKIYPDGTIKDGRLYDDHRVYEDVTHLGEPMSHGCVRFGIDESAYVFGWADVGTKVTVA
jgi:lipoprotein-anchoring transpeptidase ErfK/SrfK